MARRHSNETILVQWTIDESLWRNFLVEKEALDRSPDGPFYTFTLPKEFPATGLDVVIRDDAIFVGKKCVREYVYDGGYHWMSVHDSVLVMNCSSESGNYIYLLPIPPGALDEAERVTEQFTAADKQEASIRAEKAARPTIPNKLLKWVEAHFVLTILIIFFGIIPLFVFIIALLFPDD